MSGPATTGGPPPALDGVRVLDFTRVISGPYLTMTLADLGAEVTKVENPAGGDDTRHYLPERNGETANFMALNRLKKSVALDLGQDRDRAVAARLAAASDVVVENFRPGVMERLGLGYETLKERNPGLVYCAISGYGGKSAYRNLAGYDPVVQAESGLMYLTGHPGSPPVRAGGSVVDVLTALHAGMGVLAALVARQASGHGQRVDVALYDTALASTAFILQGALMTGDDPPRLGNTSFFMAPNGTFACADGDVVISAGNDRLFGKLCAVLGEPALATDPRFGSNASRLRNLPALTAILQQRLADGTRAHWIDRLRAVAVPVGAVRTPVEALASQETEQSGLLHDVDHPSVGPVRAIGSAINLSVNQVLRPGAAPRLGEHTAEVLEAVLGVSTDGPEAEQGVSLPDHQR